MSIVRFAVAGQPLSVNRLYRSNGHGGLRKTEEGRYYQGAIAHAAVDAWHDAGRPLSEKYMVRLCFFFKTRRSDIDGPIKTVLDGLQDSGAMANDSQIYALEVSKAVDKTNPRVDIEIHPLAGDA